MDCLAYRQALSESARQLAPSLDHRGQDADLPVECPFLCQSQDGVTLTVCLNPANKVIRAARFQAGKDETILEVFCRTIDGMPLEEAAAYGADYALHHLTGSLDRPSDVGILRAAALLPALGTAQAILRGIRNEARAEPGMASIYRARFLDVPAAWRELPAEDRLERIREILASHLAELGVAADLLRADRLEDDIRGRPVRVTLTHAKGADTSALPGIMRALEKRLRQKAAPWLELYAEERVDRNALRRTILIEQRPA